MAGEGDANAAESLRLTRSATIYNSLLRFYGTGKLPSQLVLHIVGSDHREGRTPDQTRSVFRDLHQWLWDEGVRTLSMLLCGPNISPGLHGTRHTFSHQTHTLRLARPGDSRGGDGVGDDDDDVALAEHEGSLPIPKKNVGICDDCIKYGDSTLLVVTLQFDKGLYHDVAHLFSAPDAMFLFNAGLWGYDDWLPTMELILRPVQDFSDRRVPAPAQANKVDMIVVTSYCAEEAEDDMDTLEQLLVCGQALEPKESSSKTETLPIENGTFDSPSSTALGRSVGGVKWLWGPEVNPSRSLVPRNTSCGEEGRLLFENHSWQAVCPLQLGNRVNDASA